MSPWIEKAALMRPDRVALEGPERSLTYAELAGAAAAGAGRLARLAGARPERVALELEPGEEWVIALHACIALGAAVVPVDRRLGDGERAIRRGRAQLTVDGPLSGAAAAAPPRDVGDDVRPGDSASPGDGVRPGGHVRPGDDARRGDDRRPLAVMHTSGTTSDPKPIVLSHGNFLASALGSAVALGLDPDERWLCPMPLTHVGGLSIPVRSAIYATTVVLHGRFDTEAVLRELMDPARRVTLVSLVPTMLSRLLDAGLANPPTLRWALLGGGPIAPALTERALAAGVPLAPSYGMTETCSQIATFGYPLAGVELAIGGDEILVRGPIVSAGSLAGDGWLHTGDLGRLDERGRLEIIGRRADTIISGGENVAPAEVEAALLEHPDVADAGVHGRPDAEWGEVVVAKVVARDGMLVEPDALRAFCAARIARFKVPKAIEIVDGLPRTASGKLLRRELR